MSKNKKDNDGSRKLVRGDSSETKAQGKKMIRGLIGRKSMLEEIDDER